MTRENFISFRKKDAGGELLNPPDVSLKALVPRYQYILLIHGYNVSRVKAEKSYEDFTEFIESTTTQNIIYVYWPGDAKFRVISELSYPWQPERAKKTAQYLAKYIKQRIDQENEDCQWVFIGHSLGCRVIVETLRELYIDEGLNKKKISTSFFLMAAGIPVGIINKRNPLWKGINRSKPRVVYYSTADWVLQFAFPAGQSLALHDIHLLPEAVGRHGRPENVWSLPASQKMNNYGHGSYWGSNELPSLILGALNKAVPRTEVTRHILEDRTLPPDRSLPTRSDPPDRSL